MALRRRTWVMAIAAAAAVAVIVALIAIARVPLSSERLRQSVEGYLADRLNSTVELQGLTLRLLPELHVVGTGLSIHHKGRTDVPPLISVKRFTVDSGFALIAHGRIARVSLEGLDIEIPPHPEKTPAEELRDAKEHEQAQLEALKLRAVARTHRRGQGGMRDMVIDALVADDARLAVIPRDPDGPPKVWAMHQLRMRNVGSSTAMPFHSVLTNGVPPGEVDIAGTFGPWDANTPDYTAVEGQFNFAHADLGVFKGISGNLSAQGTFRGTLGTIRANGTTDTPDFTIALANHPIHLKTTYQALVDATNGDTMLEDVHAQFLDTTLVAKGGVFDVKGVKGRLVKVSIVMDKGRIEDVMQLAISTPGAPMTGGLRLSTRFELPPGDQDIVEKLALDGTFDIQNGRFTDPDVQKKIAELSQRASGKMKEDPADFRKVRSDFSGKFKLANGTLHIPRVTFNVPGAVVDISGQFMLRPPQTLAFNGNLYTDAKVSQMTTGFKSLLLKVIDPIFRHDGRTVVPLKVTGTRDDPSFGLDIKKVFAR